MRGKMNRKEYKLPNGRTAVFEYDDNGVGRISLEALDILMGNYERNCWIPVTERLPEELEEVNITWINTAPEPYYDFIKGKPFTGTAVYHKGRWYWYSAVCNDYLAEYGISPNDTMDECINVIAWMPLPEPYKEEQE